MLLPMKKIMVISYGFREAIPCSVARRRMVLGALGCRLGNVKTLAMSYMIELDLEIF